jgi:curved DNA-binding protein CbpA
MTNEPSQGSITDYYESLQVSQNADFETIERVYRFLAKRYHPDNPQTGNGEKFKTVVEAFSVLSDPEKRAAYDVKYERARTRQWSILDEMPPSNGVQADRRIRDGVLSLLYVARRRDASNPGLGILDLERPLGCPEKHMEFHVWYLKEKGWIERGDDGRFAITASGVDAAIGSDILLRKDRLLPPADNSSAERQNRRNQTYPRQT